MSLLSPSPPFFTWSAEPTFTGAGTLPLGGDCVGPVHAESMLAARRTPHEQIKEKRRVRNGRVSIAW